MLQSILHWLRASVKAAFLGGIQDALQELDAAPADGTAIEAAPDVAAALRARFVITAEPMPPATGRKKGPAQ